MPKSGKVAAQLRWINNVLVFNPVRANSNYSATHDSAARSILVAVFDSKNKTPILKYEKKELIPIEIDNTVTLPTPDRNLDVKSTRKEGPVYLKISDTCHLQEALTSRKIFPTSPFC